MDVTRLERFAVLAALPSAERESIAAVMGEEAFETGHTVASSGDFGYALYAVEEGSAEVLDADGVLLRTLGPGDMFGEIALLKAGRRSATVRTTAPTRVLALFVQDFLRVREAVPAFEQSMRALADARLTG